MNGNPSRLSGRRILVLGGTGFLGSRLVERLIVEANAEVRVLVRNFASAVRIARYPVSMEHGDLLDAAAVERAAGGCDIIIHCAYGNTGDGPQQRRVTVEGTRNVMEAALRTRPSRVVLISTVSVYGALTDGDLTEDSPRRGGGSAYGNSKREAEQLALDYYSRHNVPVTVLQPTIIYGPYGPLWTVEMLEQLRSTGVMMIDGGQGLCNLVYVDDVVSAILLASVEDSAVGKTFLISAEHPVTWRDYYRRYEQMLGLSSRTLDLTAAEARAYYRRRQAERKLPAVLREAVRGDAGLRERIIMTPEVGRVLRLVKTLISRRAWASLKRWLGAEEAVDPVRHVAVARPPLRPAPLHPLDIQLHAAKTFVRVDKAKRLLGYAPAFDLEEGMRRTEAWAAWANLLAR